jgi:hypothetical protein
MLHLIVLVSLYVQSARPVVMPVLEVHSCATHQLVQGSGTVKVCESGIL